MFERYTQKARRVIFFSRYEASQFGGRTIESEGLLLGLLREDRNLITGFVADLPSIAQIRSEITRRVTIQEKLPTSVDLPLSEECIHILNHTAEEAERLNHRTIGTEHLLLGMLRETSSLAAEILRSHGLNLSSIRESIAARPPPQDAEKTDPLPEAGCVPDPETAVRIAEAVWIPLYGEDTVKQQRPFETDLTASVWTVRGTSVLNQAAESLVIAISKIDGRILKIGTSVFRGQFLKEEGP